MRPSLSVVQTEPSNRKKLAPALSSPLKQYEPSKRPSVNHLNPTGSSDNRRLSFFTTRSIMLLLTSAILQVSGIGATTLWSYVPVFHMWAVLFVHLVAGHGLSFAPIYAWLLLVSAWARRTPFLWAVLPPLAIAGVEKIAFNTSYFAGMLASVAGGPQSSAMGRTMSMDAMTPALGDLLSSPGLWIGFGVAAVFLVAAIRLRRDRGPI